MSKFTKEQLVNYVKGCIEHAERFPGVEIADKEKAIFEIALTALTAPAVPDEVTSETKPNSSYEWRKGFNACRATMIQEPDAEQQLHIKTEEDPISARRRRNRESNARARKRETPEQGQARKEKNRLRMRISRKSGAL